MTDVVRRPATTPNDAPESGRSGLSADALRRGIIDHLRYSIARPAAVLTPEHFYRATALAVRDRMQDNWAATVRTSLDLGRKATCYLSAES
jgi:glycogen phosphorylase